MSVIRISRTVPALLATAGLMVQLTAPVWAADDFGAGWQAKPLVDHAAQAAKPMASSQQTTPEKPVQPNQAALEARLKPAEPFIQSVEKQLSLTPKAGMPLISRLNTIQMVLYGESKYQDAGELLGKLAEVFPAEAAKASADLNAQLKAEQPPQVANRSSGSSSKSGQKTKPTVGQPQAATGVPVQPQYANPAGPTIANTQNTAKKKHFWNQGDSGFSDFDHDPFFQDKPAQSATQTQGQIQNYSGQTQSGPSKIGAIGQGLAGLAMMAGSVAGNYYLNRKLGNGYNGSAYNNPYYNTPYGYGTPAYGNYGYNAYGAPYGYNNAYGYAQPYYGAPWGSTTVISKPYQGYGTFGSGNISPLGVPMGTSPY